MTTDHQKRLDALLDKERERLDRKKKKEIEAAEQKRISEEKRRIENEIWENELLPKFLEIAEEYNNIISDTFGKIITINKGGNLSRLRIEMAESKSRCRVSADINYSNGSLRANSRISSPQFSSPGENLSLNYASGDGDEPVREIIFHTLKQYQGLLEKLR